LDDAEILVGLGKERRENPNFIGAEQVIKHLKDGPSRRRIGLIVDGAPARRTPDTCCRGFALTKYTFSEGAVIHATGSEEVIGKPLLPSCRLTNDQSCGQGTVASGIPSPTLNLNIAMGYVKSGWHKKGTELQVMVRKQLRKAVVTPMPFVKAKYYRG
jgi:aminomethyltransferase